MSLAWSSVKALSIPVGGTARNVKRVSVGGVTIWTKPSPLPYDAEVEWLESTGTQYIDTGFVPTHNSEFRVLFSPDDVSFATHPVHGNAYAASSRYISSVRAPLTLWHANGYNNRFFNAPASYSGWSAGGIYSVVQNAGGLYVDETLIAQYSGLLAALDEPMWLFKFVNWATDVFGLLKLYSWQAYDNGALVRDFIPVRVGSGANAVGCLYDKLGTGGMNPDGTARDDGLYFNRGSGAFVVGPDKSS